MQIAGIQGLSPAQLEQALLRGGRVVLFQYCVSIGIMTFKRPSRAFYVPVGGSAALAGLPTTLLTLVAGWWGIPWGPIYTIQSLITNLSGGKDVTADVLSSYARARRAAALEREAVARGADPLR
jgi:hypothetical protein